MVVIDQKLVDNRVKMIKILIITMTALVYLTDAYYVKDYYWKDFDGAIPNDAFSAGENQYIGQGLTMDGRILIGAIHKSSNFIMAYDTKTDLPIKIKTSLKILCTQNPEYFIWSSSGLKKKDKMVRVYAGVDKYNVLFPFGSLIIARTANESLVGFEDAQSVDYNMYYVVDGVAKKEYDYEDLFYRIH